MWRTQFSSGVPDAVASEIKKISHSDDDHISDDEGTGKLEPRQSINIQRMEADSDEKSVREIWSEQSEDMIDAEDPDWAVFDDPAYNFWGGYTQIPQSVVSNFVK